MAASSATAAWSDLDAPVRAAVVPRPRHATMVLAGVGATALAMCLMLSFQWAVASWGGLTRFAQARPTGTPLLTLAEQSEWVHGAAQLAGAFETARFDLAAVRAGAAAVPRLYVTTLPQDLGAIAALPDRKEVFIRLALPLVLRVNETILDDRQRLLAIDREQQAAAPISYAERQWLEDVAQRYGVPAVDLKELLLRVDEIPPSLALAQAATESGWGTSRIARAGNALFGQKVWGEAGIAPLAGRGGEKFRYAAFDELMDGIGAYARNLNTHPAYAAFREARARMRATQGALDGLALSSTLGRYSTRGADYVGDLQMLIYDNWLWAYDRARLDEDATARLLVPAI